MKDIVVASGENWEIIGKYDDDADTDNLDYEIRYGTTLRIFCIGNMSDYDWQEDYWGYTYPWLEYHDIDTVIFDERVTSISEYACHDLSYLTRCVIRGSVHSIGNSAFYGCSDLESITLPAGLTEIGTYAFYGCEHISTIVFPNSLVSIGLSAFEDCTGLESITIPGNVSYIGQEAFRACTNLQRVEFSNEFSGIIEYSCFSLCYSLTDIIFSDSIDRITDSMFYYCQSLRSIVIPNSVQRIDTHAFMNCFRLAVVTIPSSVTRFDYDIFQNCENLSDIYYDGTEADWNEIENLEDAAIPNTTTIHYLSAPLVPEPDDPNPPIEPDRPPPTEQEIDASKRYHGIWFGAFNSWIDFNLVSSSPPSVVPPPPKTNFVDIPGGDGGLDFTEVLDNKIHYGRREGSWEFYVYHEEIENYNWTILWQELLENLHGKFFAIKLDDEQETDPWLYFGRVWLSDFQSDPSHSKVVINYNLDPFCYPSMEAYEAKTGGSL